MKWFPLRHSAIKNHCQYWLTTMALAACGWTVAAAVPERAWPSIEVAPLLDVPMRDTALTRRPDGMYYLTGTLAAQQRVADRGSRGKAGATAPRPDFDNSPVVKLWRSADLKTWTDLGVVWDIGAHKNAGEWHWMSYWRVPLGPEYLSATRARRCRARIALPEEQKKTGTSVFQSMGKARG